YRLVLRRDKPVCETRFHLPTSRKLDVPLIAGSAIFGIGWGISGFCPGGAIPALGLGEISAWAFVGSMLVGIFAARIAHAALEQRSLKIASSCCEGVKYDHNPIHPRSLGEARGDGIFRRADQPRSLCVAGTPFVLMSRGRFRYRHRLRGRTHYL